jgi:GGDEF domain-containing protein
MPQEIFNVTDKMLEELMRQAMAKIQGATAAPAPGIPVSMPSASPLPSRIQETYETPPVSTAADFLDELREQRKSEMPGTAPMTAAPAVVSKAAEPAAPRVDIQEPLRTSTSYGDMMRGGLLGGGLYKPVPKQKKPSEMTVEEGIAAYREEQKVLPKAQAGVDKFFGGIEEGAKPIGKIAAGKGNVFVATAETLSNAATGIGGFIVGTVGAAGKLLVDTVQGKGDFVEAERFGEKVSELLTYKPKTERGQAMSEVLMSPFTILTEVIRAPGKIIWPNNPQAQASWNLATNIAMVATGAAKKRMAPKFTESGKVVFAPAKQVDLKAFNEYQAWYKERAKSSTPPTTEEVRQAAANAGISQPLIDWADEMQRNWESQGAETPEGRLGPARAAAPEGGTTISTADGTTIKVTPPKAAPYGGGVPQEGRAAYDKWAIDQEARKPAAVPDMRKVSIPEPQAEGNATFRSRSMRTGKPAPTPNTKRQLTEFGEDPGVERRGEGEWKPQLREIVEKAKRNEAMSPTDLEILNGAAQEIERLQRIAFTDELTGAPNRAALANKIGPELNAPDGMEIAVLDLGKLKGINDGPGGHAAGDAALANIVKAAKARKLEIYRTGGDEYVVLGKKGTLNSQLSGFKKAAKDRAGLNVHYGIDSTFEAADAKMYKMKNAAPPTERRASAKKPELPIEEEAEVSAETRASDLIGFEDVPETEGAAPAKAYPWEEENAPQKPAATPAPTKETPKPEKASPGPSQAPSREEIRRIIGEESAKYDKARPAPRDAEGRARHERDKAGFLKRVVAARMKNKDFYAGFFGGGEIAALYEAWKEARGPKSEKSGALANLMERFNELSKYAMAKDPGASGWDLYRTADAQAKLPELEGMIRKTWQDLNEGLGAVRTTIRAKTQEGRDAQARIADLQRQLRDIDAEYDTLTRGNREQFTTMREAGSREVIAAEAAGLKTEKVAGGRYGGFIEESVKEAESAMYPRENKAKINTLMEERIDIANRIREEEPRVGELEIVHEPTVGERPPVFQEPEPIAREQKPKKLTKEEALVNSYSQKDWLDAQAAKLRKRARTPEEKARITPERLGHEQVYASLSLVEEHIRKARARKTKPNAEMVLAGFPKSHPLYQPLHEAIKAGDMEKASRIVDNARNRLYDYAAEEGAPYLESPAIPAGETIDPTTGKPVYKIPERTPGTLKDRAGRKIPAYEPPREEAGPVQFREQNPETQARNQQQWRRSMKDLHKADTPGLPGHFSHADQFPRLFPEAGEGAPADVVRRANAINDMAVKIVDKLIQEGIRQRLAIEKVDLASEYSIDEAGNRVFQGVTKAERGSMKYGGITLEEAIAAKRADAWVKIFNKLKKDRNLGQLSQITEVVREHMAKKYESQAAREQAIMAGIRNLPISKMIFKYPSGMKGSMLKDLTTVERGAALDQWQIEQAVFDAYRDSIAGGLEGQEGGFAEALGRELTGMAQSEFALQGTRSNTLNHLALKIFAQKFWDEKYLNDYSGGNPIKKRAIEMMMKEGDSAPVAQFRLRQEFGERGVPDKPENIAAWAGRRDPATGELTGYVKYIAEQMEDWGPDAVKMFKKMSDPIVKGQGLTGGPIESPTNIMRTYFDPIVKKLDELAGTKDFREKLGDAFKEKEKRRSAREAEMARLREEKAAQEKDIRENPDKYNVIEVDEEAALEEATRKKYPWEDEEGGGGEGPASPVGYIGFLGGGGMQYVYEAISRGIKKYISEFSERRSEKAARLDAAAGVHKFESPETQARWEKGTRASRNDPASTVMSRAWQDVKNSLTRVYTKLPNTPQFALLTDRLKWLEKEYVRAANEALSVYNGDVLKVIDSQPEMLKRRRLEDTFSKKVFLDDLKEMYDGGAVEFPQGITRESLMAEIDTFNRFLSEMDPVEQQVIRATMDSRKAVYEKITGEIIAEGDKAGYNFRDIFSRRNYYRHELMMHFDREIRGGKKMKPSTYSWGSKRRTEGYAADIVTDVRMVDAEVLSRLIYERDRLRVHNTIDEGYNIHGRIAAEAEARGMTMKEAYDKLIPEGYSLYQFDKNHLIFNSLTVSERLARKILEGRLNEITPGDVNTIRERMAIGPKREPWVVPDEVAATLDDFAKARPEPAWWQKAPATALGYWKGWKLLGPKRILKFQFRNLTGDAEMHAIGNPSTFTKVKQSVKMLNDYYHKGIASPEILEWIDKGGMDTTFHWAEIGDFQRLWKWSEKMGDQPGSVAKPIDALKKGWNSYADWAKRSSDLREGTLRLASYLDYREQFAKNMAAGRGERPNNYGASNRAFIDALPDVQTKAFWLSNELSGAYDLVSPAGRAARGSAVPFWSWKEITAKRYYRMLKNAYIDGKTARQIGGQFIKGAPYAALKVGTFVLKANAVMAILQAINHNAPGITGDPEAEEKLPLDVQRRPHITFGNLPWEKPGTGHYFSQVGAASDLLDAFGMDIPSEMVMQMVRGETDLEKIAKDWWKDKPIVNHIFQSITPFIKVPADLLYGRKTYPNLMRPRGIRDPFEYVADQFDIGSEYRMLMDRPGKEPAVKYLEKYFDYQHEEDETAYFDWIGIVNDFKKSRGANTIGYSVTPKSNYLSWFKRARSEGDDESAQKFFKKYIAAAYLEGGYKGKDPETISKGIVQSIRESYKEMFPLAKMTPQEIADLSATLPDKKKKILVRALRYWTNVLVGPEDAPGITAEIEDDNKEE